MKKIIMLSGLPCSGKTSRAFVIMSNIKKSVRIHPELLSGMLFLKDKKKETIKIALDIAKKYLKEDYTVVIDDINLDKKDIKIWKELSESTHAEFEEIPLRPKLNFCVFHDAWKADGSLGFDVINAMAMKYGLMEAPPKEFVLFDIDSMMRDKLDPSDPEYLKKMRLNPLNDNYLARIKELASLGYKIVFFSRQPIKMKGLLMDWLNTYGLWKGDAGFTPVTIFVDMSEKDIYKTYFKDKYQIYRIVSNGDKSQWEKFGLYVENVV